MENLTPLRAVERSLEVTGRDRTWVKWGHGRFATIQRTAVGYEVRPTKGVGADRGQTGEVYDLAWLLRLSEETEEQGVFWIAAATDADAPLKDAITKTDVLSCEIDLCGKDEQLERFAWFSRVSGLEYGLQLSSGSKSIHVHIFLNKPVAFDDADRLRKLFILCLLGDPAIANRHQPMRAPGFFRKSKGNYQELLASSEQRYSLSEVEAGLQAVYADLGWAYPATLSADLWRDCLRLLKAQKDDAGNELAVDAAAQRAAIAELLQRGDGYYVELAKGRAARAEANRLHRAQLELSGEFDLVGAVSQIDERLSAEQAFSGFDHQWAYSGSDKARGFCGFHAGTTNSAWLSRGDKGWAFHCPTCTGDRPLSGFAYWLAEQRGASASFPTGKDWAKLATEYAQIHGVTVPVWQPGSKGSSAIAPTGADQPKAQPGDSGDRLAEKKAARLLGKLKEDREQWAKAAKEINSTFAKTDDIENDIKRAKRIIFASTTEGVEYDKTIKNTGGAFDEATLESLMQITAPILVGGETGGGKTELGTQLAAYAKQQNDGLTYGAIAPTQVLSVQVAERFEQKGLPMESTAIIGKGDGGGKKPKALPAESLWKSKGNQLEFLAADEPDQWVPRVLTGILGDAADANLAVLRDLARNIPHQLWLNADPNPITADLIGELSGRKPIIIDLQRDQPKKPVSVDWYRDGLNEGGLPVIGSGRLYQDFIGSARRGEKALLLAGSVKKARAIRNQLRKHGIKVLLKDGKYTPKEQRLGFALAPEKAMQNYDVVILTRLVETGLDLQRDFDAVYVALSPKMEARSAYQFLSRSRSLLRGDTPKLCIYSPSNTLTGIEQLSPKYWEERLKSENKIYAGLLRGDTSKVFTKLGAIEWAIGYQARYKADSARQTFFRGELLRAKFSSLGWKIDNEFSPNETSPLSEILKKEVFRADWMEATCTARGHRSILEYSESYAEKISDPNQQGLILECKRRKLELSSLLPGSDLEDISLIFELSQDERLLPQTLLWSAIEIDPHSERMQKLLSFLNSTHIEKFELYGALEGIKNLRKSKAMLALAVAEILAGDPCLERVRSGDDIIHKHQADTQQLAAKLDANSDLINTWCRRHFGREFEWGEGCVSVVCKALDKLLGIKSAATGQSTEKAKGKKARVHNYRTAFSVEGQEAIAKRTETGVDEVLFDFVKRFSLMESAQQGWLKKMEEVEPYIQQRCGGVHTKMNTSDLDTGFSVHPPLASSTLPRPKPAIAPKQMALSGATFASASPESLADGYYDSAAWD